MLRQTLFLCPPPTRYDALRYLHGRRDACGEEEKGKRLSASVQRVGKGRARCPHAALDLGAVLLGDAGGAELVELALTNSGQLDELLGLLLLVARTLGEELLAFAIPLGLLLAH